MKTPKIKQQAQLREQQYIIHLEIGLIAAIVILLFAFKINYLPEKEEIQFTVAQEVVFSEDIIQTKQEEKVPPPPRPVVPIEVANDEIISEEIELNLDSELDLDTQLDIPAPPPSAPEQETAEEEEERVFVVVERMPELIGGLASLNEKITYPEIARMARIEGRVIVQFIVDERGNVVDPYIVRGIGGGCDEEALRVVKELKFKPGLQRGTPVKVQYAIPVTFKLVKSSST